MTFSSCSICAYARGARSAGPYRSRAPVIDQLPQPAVLGVPVGHVERRQLRRDQRQPERALLAEFGGGGHHFGPLREQPGHLVTRAQVRATQRSQPPGGLVQGLPGPDRAHRHGQPSARRCGEVRCGGGDDADPEPRRQPGQRRRCVRRRAADRAWVSSTLTRSRAEPVHQIGQRPPRRIRTAIGKRLAHMAFAASGQDVPVPAGRLGQRVEVVARLALLAAGQVRGRQLPRQPPVAFRARGPAPADAGRAGRAARCGRRTPATVRRRTRCARRVPPAASANRTTPYRPSWSVSARARRSSRAASSTSSSGVLAPSRKLYAECACSSAYERNERRTTGPTRRPSGGSYLPRLRDQGTSPLQVGSGSRRRRTGMARLAVEHPLHFRPARRPVKPAHVRSLSKVCSI